MVKKKGKKEKVFIPIRPELRFNFGEHQYKENLKEHNKRQQELKNKKK